MVGSRRVSADGRDAIANGTCDWRKRRTRYSADRNARPGDQSASLEGESRTLRPVADRFECRGQLSGGSTTNIAFICGDGRVRIRQELLLGVGGFRALKAMGVTPGVLHLNEGHSAFGVLEAIRSRMVEEGIGFDHAVSTVARHTVFTTHTPVPAGHDRFNVNLMEEHLGPMRDALGLSLHGLMAPGPRESKS